MLDLTHARKSPPLVSSAVVRLLPPESRHVLRGGPQVMATGGGAFMNPDTRAAIRTKGVSIWLKADYDVLLRRVKRRGDRPMLKTADPAETLKRLIAERYPVYAEADLTLHSRDAPHEAIVSEAIAALAAHCGFGNQPSAIGL